MKKILVLGCTGSIGTSTLNIVRSMPEDFSICGLTAHNNEKSLNFLSNELILIKIPYSSYSSMSTKAIPYFLDFFII